jgi:hypothetical protein
MEHENEAMKQQKANKRPARTSEQRRISRKEAEELQELREFSKSVARLMWRFPMDLRD